MDNSLKKNIKEFIESKLENITLVDEIFKFLNDNIKEKWTTFEISNENIDEFFNKYYEFKKELQLNINSHNNCQYFNNCVVQPVGYSHIANNYGASLTDNLLIDMIYNYIIYYVTILNWEAINLKKECQIVNDVIDKCPLCDTDINDGDESCSVCQEPFSEYVLSYKRTQNDINGEVDKKKAKINNESEDENLLNNDQRNDITNSNNGNNKSFTNILLDNPNEWICKTCEILHKYTCNTCNNCKNDRIDIGSWCCTGCSYVNDFRIDNCVICNYNNDQLHLFDTIIGGQKTLNNCNNPTKHNLNNSNETSNNKNDKTGGMDNNKSFFDILINNVDKWICKNCQLLNTRDSRFCEVCEKDAMNIGVWMCKDCSCISDIINKCGACGLDSNLPFVVGNNKKQNNKKQNNKIKKANDNNSKIIKSDIKEKWKCWYNGCFHNNDSEKDFCESCKICKKPPEHDNAIVHCFTKEGLKEVWVCIKCNKRNGVKGAKCSGKNCGTYQFYVGGELKSENKMYVVEDIKTEDSNINDSNIDNSNSWSCDKCTYNNDNKLRLCEICNNPRFANEVIGTNNTWKCCLGNCKTINNCDEQYCKECKIYRYSKHERGEIVNRQVKDKIEQIWVCYKCFKFNELDKQQCTGKKCTEYRFAKK